MSFVFLPLKICLVFFSVSFVPEARLTKLLAIQSFVSFCSADEKCGKSKNKTKKQKCPLKMMNYWKLLFLDTLDRQQTVCNWITLISNQNKCNILYQSKQMNAFAKICFFCCCLCRSDFVDRLDTEWKNTCVLAENLVRIAHRTDFKWRLIYWNKNLRAWKRWNESKGGK